MPNHDAGGPATPRRELLWATAVYTLVTLALGFPALAGQFLVNPRSDQYIAGYAFREFAAATMREGGGVPLWNPYLFGGMPYVAAMHGDTFYPVSVLLRAVLPTDAAMTWGFMIHIALAGLFTFLFLRRALGLGFYGALLGGLAYAAGGNLAGLVSPGHDGKTYVATLLPLVLFFVHRGVRDGRAWSWGALALAVTCAVLSPHPQLLQYLLLVAGAYGLYAAFAPGADGVVVPRGLALRRLGLAAIAVALGFLGSAIQYWPVMEYTPWSPRAGGKDWEHAISFSMPPEELLNTYLPQFTGILDRYWGRNSIHFHSDYIGASVLALVGLAFGASGERRRQVWFWTGVLVVATLWALGGYTPFYSIIYTIVPGTKYFRAPSTMLYVVSFATAVLAGIGVDRALSGALRPRYVIGWVAAASVIALLATSGALTNLGAGFALPGREALVEENATALTLGAWRSLVAVAAVLGVLLAAARGRLRPALAGAVAVGVVGLDLWSVVRSYWQFTPPAAETFAADPVVNYLRTQTDSGRVLPLELQGGAPVTPRDPFLGGDALMVHRVRQTLGYHGNELGRYQQLYGGERERANIANPNFWRLTNTRFILTNAPELPLPGATLVAGPARNAVGSMQYLYRLPGDLPPAWVTPLSVKAPDENVLATVLDPRFDIGRVALFDTSAAVPTQVVPSQLPAPLDLRARVSSRQPGRINVALDRPAPAGSALVVSENYYPGWTARVDGTLAPVGRVDFTLIGVPLPAGAQQVELQFTSPRYERGKAITLAAFGLSLVLAGAGVMVDRRRRNAASA